MERNSNEIKILSNEKDLIILDSEYVIKMLDSDTEQFLIIGKFCDKILQEKI